MSKISALFATILALSLQNKLAYPPNGISTILNNQTVSFNSLVNEVKSGGKTVFTVTAKYPVINGNSEQISAVNSAIEAGAKALVADCAAKYNEQTKEFAELEAARSYSCEIIYDVKTLNNDIISAYISETSFLGGVHPNTIVSGITYSLQTGKKMTADDFVKDAVAKGKSGIHEMVLANPEEYPFYNGETFELDNNSFYIENGKLIFFVQAYEIAPYARGIVEYAINID